MTQATEKQINYIKDLTKVSKLGTINDLIFARATLNFDLTKDEASEVITFLKNTKRGIITPTIEKFLGKTGTAWFQIHISTARGLTPRMIEQIESIAGDNLSAVVDHFSSDWKSFNMPALKSFIESLSQESEIITVQYTDHNNELNTEDFSQLSDAQAAFDYKHYREFASDTIVLSVNGKLTDYDPILVGNSFAFYITEVNASKQASRVIKGEDDQYVLESIWREEYGRKRVTYTLRNKNNKIDCYILERENLVIEAIYV